MWTISTAAQAQIAGSSSIDLRATAYGPTGGAREVPISGGTVTSDSKSQVRRTATVEIADPDLWPANPLDVLSPYGAELSVEYGIVLRDKTTEWIPMGRFVLSQNQRGLPVGSSGMSLQLVDRSAVVAEDRFTSPQQTVSGATAVSEIRRLIQDTLGDSVQVVDLTGSTQVAPVLDMAKERWSDGVEQLADAIGAEVFADPLGDFVIRPQPQLTDSAAWWVPQGSQGILISETNTLAREDVWNQWVISGQRTDGTPPVYAVVTDNDPDSPTYFRPGFKRTRYYSSPLLTTVAQCQATGAAMLARSQGGGAKVSLGVLVNPAVEAGDVIALPRPNGAVEVYIVDKVTTPLDPGGVQQIDTRGLTIPAEQ